jgi:hypothetical protein
MPRNDVPGRAVMPAFAGAAVVRAPPHDRHAAGAWPCHPKSGSPEHASRIPRLTELLWGLPGRRPGHPPCRGAWPSEDRCNVSRLVLLAALLMPLAVQGGYFMKGAEMLNACTSNHVIDQGQCIGYLMGVADSFQAMQYVMGTSLVCLPEDVTVGNLRLVFIRYAKAHPAELDERGRLAVEAAFVEAFPCPNSP